MINIVIDQKIPDFMYTCFVCKVDTGNDDFLLVVFGKSQAGVCNNTFHIQRSVLEGFVTVLVNRQNSVRLGVIILHVTQVSSWQPVDRKIHIISHTVVPHNWVTRRKVSGV